MSVIKLSLGVIALLVALLGSWLQSPEPPATATPGSFEQFARGEGVQPSRDAAERLARSEAIDALQDRSCGTGYTSGSISTRIISVENIGTPLRELWHAVANAWFTCSWSG